MEMATDEEEMRFLREKNNELAQKVQHFKMLASQRENENFDLMKEINDMRLKLARLRSNGNIQASKLDSALQSASEKALAHLVKASGEIARTIDLTKTYMRERIEVETVSPRWNSNGGTPNVEKIHRVPPMNVGGQSIQPVVSLSRTLYTSNTRPAARSPNQTRSVTERGLPIHMLQDVYIPLTRIDAELNANNVNMEEGNGSEDSAEELGLEDSGELELEESQRMSDDIYDTSRLNAVIEDLEPEDGVETPQRNSRSDNPLEGPSWLLDAADNINNTPPSSARSGRNLEPDSTTEVEGAATRAPASPRDDPPESVPRVAGRLSHEFSPTVRRRKRDSPVPAGPPATPRREHFSPRPHHRRTSNSGRVLKVMVAKMRMESLSPAAPQLPQSLPPKRRAEELELLDAPSPNGATVPGVIVSETTLDPGASGEPLVHVPGDRRPGHDRSRPGHDPRQPSHDHRRPSHDQRHDPRLAGLERRPSQRSSEGDSHMDESVKETRVKQKRECRDYRSRRQGMSSQLGGTESSDSGDEGPTRSRRVRNKVSYRERPLNRKLRR